MTVREMHQSNRAAWNEAAAHYAEDLEGRIAFLRAGGANFCEAERPYLRDLGAWCRRAIHLQCAGGTDTLSLWNLGAQEVVGVDISEDMIAVARQKSDALDAPARWFRCDILDTPHELDGTADLVYTGRGALCWLHDMDGWASVVARLLRSGGRLYVFEGHPLNWVWDGGASEYRIDPTPGYGDYFSGTTGTEAYINEQTHGHERQWRLGAVLSALAGAGLRLEKFEEYPDQYHDFFPNIPADLLRRLPHTFSLLMRKD
jgi:SAM-dependent methyltransferase